jgi:membrane-bound metal-dependent hydrolase YbcI (DUF457 family)
MFIGHYSLAFAAKAVRRSPSLAAGFIAVQLVDIGFFTLAWLGVEKWRFDATLTGIMPFDLYYFPFTHSLLAAAVWALAAAMLVMLWTPPGRKAIAGAVIGTLVFSHWVLDLLVHRHDLSLVDDAAPKLGFGLWNVPKLEMPLEIALTLAGFFIYLSSTRARGAWGERTPWIVLAVLLLLQAINWFGAPPQDALSFCGLGLFAYALCAGMAWGLDRTRQSSA